MNSNIFISVEKNMECNITKPILKWYPLIGPQILFIIVSFGFTKN